MNRYHTKGVILRRIDYGEADRIITFFTPDRGKISAIAKGVRKPKSKLAGGVELFSVCDIGGIKGKRDLDTLVSTRLNRHFENIVKDYDKIQVAYSMLQVIDKLTDDDAGEDFYRLVVDGLELLDQGRVAKNVAACWFYMQTMKLHGSVPNLLKDIHGDDLRQNTSYTFSTEDGGFFVSEAGIFGPDDIKAWRVFHSASAQKIGKITGLEASADKSHEVLKRFAEFQI